MLKKNFVNQIDEQLLSFLNLVENFSRLDDDIVSIFDRANQYMKNPIRDVINEFVLDARLSADINGSFEKLLRRLRGTKAEDIFNCLWICSRHDSNYAEVINDMKISVKEHLKSKKMVRAIINSAKIDIIALFVAGVLVINILNSFLTNNVFLILCSSFFGGVILLYCLVILFIAIYMIIWR